MLHPLLFASPKGGNDDQFIMKEDYYYEWKWVEMGGFEIFGIFECFWCFEIFVGFLEFTSIWMFNVS